MTSIIGSPTPKPRGGRNNHRQTKSSSFISTSSQSNPKHHAQQPNPHFHNNHQLPPNLISNNRGSARASTTMTSPRTPKAQQSANANVDASGKKKKNRKPQDKAKQEKPKPKDVITTKVLAIFPSDPVPVDIKSPPLSDELPSGQTTPSKLSSTPPSKAYAGPTFHSSPAPSALPMPKFFSKSVPATPAGTSLQTMMESDASDASDVIVPASTTREQSQLELLFRAARAENMGMKRQGSGSTSSSDATPDPFSGNFGLTMDPESPTRGNRRLTRNIPHESLFFSMDEFEKPMSPTFKKRINQTRSTTAPNVPTQASLEQEKKETANALRQYLLSPQSPQSPVRTIPVSSPSPPRPKNRSPRVQNRPPPPFAALPMSPNRNMYQPQSPRSPTGSGYFPMFTTPPAHPPLEQRPAPYTTSPAHATTTRGPAPFFQPSHFDVYMAPPPFSGAQNSRLYHNNHNSILASKLEAVKAPITQKSATDLENDLRRILMI